MSDTAQTGAAPKTKKDRSPSFPFIPLKTAIERLEAFEAHFGRHPTPVNRAGAAWGMKEQSSQADQTLAALRSFGLVAYEGVGSKRLVALTDDGRNYLRAQQDSVKAAILKHAALRPAAIRKFWDMWGADRPVDAVALDTLTLNNAFGDSGARSFLKVYDETVAYAKLSKSDKATDTKTDEDDSDENGGVPGEEPPEKPKGSEAKKIMKGERELTTGLLSKSASFRLVVSGEIGVKEIERLIAKLELDKEILADPDAEENDAKPQ